MANPNQDARSHGNGQYVRIPKTAERDAKAAELRAQGWTLQQIADELGFSDKTNARRACQRAIRDIVKEPGQSLLAMHMDRLETLYEAALDVLEDNHVVVSHGRIVHDEHGQPLKDSAPKLAAIREARATLDSFWTLTGMKKPAKVEHSGGVTYELVGVDPEDLK